MLKPSPSAELAQEIAAAVFRVAPLVRQSRLRFELEGVAVEMVKTLRQEEVETLSRLVRFGEVAGEMSQVNSGVLLRELARLQKMLDSEIAEPFRKSGNVDLSEIFPQETVLNKREDYTQEARQQAILEYIRKFPNGCRMRHLAAAFTNFSDRTLRSDVRRLVARGLIGREGGKTGPSGYLRAQDQGSSRIQAGGVNLTGRTDVTNGKLLAL